MNIKLISVLILVLVIFSCAKYENKVVNNVLIENCTIELLTKKDGDETDYYFVINEMELEALYADYEDVYNIIEMNKLNEIKSSFNVIYNSKYKNIRGVSVYKKEDFKK